MGASPLRVRASSPCRLEDDLTWDGRQGGHGGRVGRVALLPSDRHGRSPSFSSWSTRTSDAVLVCIGVGSPSPEMRRGREAGRQVGPEERVVEGFEVELRDQVAGA